MIYIVIYSYYFLKSGEMKQTFIMQLIRYGKDDDNKNNTFYISADNNIIEEKEVLRDLGVMMNNKATFDDHINKVCQAVKQKSGWILEHSRI